MIKCPNCGHENVSGTQFCEGCGEELSAAGGAPSGGAPSGGAPAGGASAGGASAGGASAAMIQCPACDNMNPAENVACEVCGAELPRPAGAPAPASPSPAAPSIAPPVPEPIPASIAAPDAAAVSSGGPVAAPTTPMPDIDVSMPMSPLATPVPGAPPVSPDAAAPAAPSVAPSAVPSGDLAPGAVKLVVEQGQTVGAQFVLGDVEMLVGREDTEEDIYPDIDLSDQDAGYVHRRHAILRFENGALTVTHLGGGNKTRVNNRPIPDDDPQPLKLGDKVAFGKVVMRVLPA